MVKLGGGIRSAGLKEFQEEFGTLAQEYGTATAVLNDVSVPDLKKINEQFVARVREIAHDVKPALAHLAEQIAPELLAQYPSGVDKMHALAEERFGPFAPAILDEVLKHPHPFVTGMALMTLRRFGEAGFEPIFRAALNETGSYGASTAALLLSLAGRPPTAAEIDRMIERASVDLQDEGARTLLSWTLDKHSPSPLLSAFRRTNDEGKEVLAYLFAQAAAKAAGTADDLIEALESKNPRVRLSASYALGKVGPGLKHVESALANVASADEDPEVAAEAEMSLKKLTDQGK